MDIHEELRINGHQPIQGEAVSELGAFFHAVVTQNIENGFAIEHSIPILL